ncbi:hypothetical protein [Zhihengliuella sp. ISTPL4]|uniref:hypothetical protein n=1 Tax=Zhihengliuella sp. ISTPL4 TaxID=2058657 RepID=UPI0018F1DA47|nr:hypothetical protein [Zhihengliuella sp. ISTPL4]
MPDSPRPASDVLWACVEDGFHVGSRGGDFLGYVDRQPDGRFAAFSASAQPLGLHATLSDATTEVVAHAGPSEGDAALGTPELVQG